VACFLADDPNWIGLRLPLLAHFEKISWGERATKREDIMKKGNLAYTLLTSAIVFGCGACFANAADAPKDNKGFTASKTTVVDLGSEIEGMAGRQLRLRLLTIEPGGHIGLHSHKDRPAVVYFLTGKDTVTFADGTSKTFGPGDTSSANKETTHWHHNDGKDIVTFVAVDVFKSAK
jgi:quercetin dioxygenase-like cupin family protein